MHEEAYYYNAIAIALFGDYDAIKKIRGTHANWEAAYRALSQESYGVQLPEPDAAFAELSQSGIQLALFSESAYPPRLREIPHPPFALYIKGDPAALAYDPAIAIVGTRRASPEGKDIARRFARDLANAGCSIVSGLAFGVDAAAHEGWSEMFCGGSATPARPAVAVLAGGLSEIYPHANEYLGRKIIESGGALVSEYPLSEPPLARRFIERNRIISGLSKGVLIIEAPYKSGALSTARFALEQNRDVFAVPGNIDRSNFAGSNLLIQQGAMLVTAPNDILQTYGIVKERRSGNAKRKQPEISAASYASLPPEESLVMRTIANADQAIDVDKIIILTRLEPRIVNRTLTLLLIKGYIKEERGNYRL